VGSAKRAQASCTAIAGEVGAYDYFSGDLVGFVTSTIDQDFGVLVLDPTAVAGEDGNLQVHGSVCGAGVLTDISFWNLEGTSYPFLAGTNADDYNDSGATYLSDTSVDMAYTGAADSTVAGALPQDIANSVTDYSLTNELAETTIFTVATDGTITPTWVNSDGTSPTVTYVLYDTYTGLYLTGDLLDTLDLGYIPVVLKILA
jgi:hypothetical protein